jgi:hypothetical protein
MATNMPVEVIKKQDWLEPIADRLQPTVAAALGSGGPIGPKLAKILHVVGTPVARRINRCADRFVDCGCRS